MRYPPLLLLALLGLAAALPPARAFCAPAAFRDNVIGVGYRAIVRAAPGCTRPAYVRKVNTLTDSVIGEPALIRVGEVERVWLFTHRLQFTLDGVRWQPLAVH